MPLYGDKLMVCSFFYHASFVQHHDLVSMPHRAKPMRYHHYGSGYTTGGMVVERLQVIYYGAFIVGIQRVGGFIENR